jgi:hypothetical protein
MDVVVQFAIHRLGFQPQDIIIYAWSIGGFTGTSLPPTSHCRQIHVSAQERWGPVLLAQEAGGEKAPGRRVRKWNLSGPGRTYPFPYTSPLLPPLCPIIKSRPVSWGGEIREIECFCLLFSMHFQVLYSLWMVKEKHNRENRVRDVVGMSPSLFLVLVPATWAAMSYPDKKKS